LYDLLMICTGMDCGEKEKRINENRLGTANHCKHWRGC